MQIHKYLHYSLIRVPVHGKLQHSPGWSLKLEVIGPMLKIFGGFNEFLLVKLLECSVVLHSRYMLATAAAVDWKGYS